MELPFKKKSDIGLGGWDIISEFFIWCYIKENKRTHSRIVKSVLAFSLST
jgi:hypothetical protein